MIKVQVEAYRLSISEMVYIKKIQELFEKNGYYFNRLPEIYYDLSECCNERRFDDEECDIIYNIDYLGVYEYQKGNEGSITLFKNRIINCAKKIAFGIGISEETVIEYLRIIVLIHELGHWITHWCHKKKQKLRAKSYENQSTEIKEIMAQLTVVWAIMNDNGYIINEAIGYVFNTLVEKQPKKYRNFKKFGNRYYSSENVINQYKNIIDKGNLVNGRLQYVAMCETFTRYNEM